MTRAQEQQERYINTPCPAKASRNKLRSVMWLNRNSLTSRSLLSEIDRKCGQKRFYRTPTEKANNIGLFKDMLQDFGGFFEEFTHTGERKKHSSGRRELRSFFMGRKSAATEAN